jgi:hypothetical protein
VLFRSGTSLGRGPPDGSHHQLAVGDIEAHDLIDSGSAAGEVAIHRRRLGRSAGEPVHDDALGCLGGGELFPDEPEDHIASLCEILSGLITGNYGEPADLARQQAFFDVHVAPWAGLFFKDLEEASGADFYQAVGSIGRLFMEVEGQAFTMAA